MENITVEGQNVLSAPEAPTERSVMSSTVAKVVIVVFPGWLNNVQKSERVG